MEKDINKDMESRISNVITIALAAIIVGLLLILLQDIVNTSMKCQFKSVFNISCPGCGGSRMLDALVKLEFYQAFRYNPFMFITIPIIVVMYIMESINYIKYAKLSKNLDKVVITYAILASIFGVVRNISIFSWLLPTEI